MSRRNIVTAALDLVGTWDRSEDDAVARADLIAEVHAYLGPTKPANECSVNQGRTTLRAFGGGNYIRPHKAEKIVELLRMGYSYRGIANELGVSKKTAARYEDLNGPFDFDTDANGKIEISTRDHAFNILGGSRHIAGKEFNAAWRALQKKVAAKTP